MKHSHSEDRFRHLLASVRILLGFVYLCDGFAKLFDATFFENGFLQRLGFWETAVAPWYNWAWQILNGHPGRWAVFFGMTELFIGICLLLGLALRPACFIAMCYTLHRFALSWYSTDQPFTLWQFFDLHLEQIALFCLFWLLGSGHAGQTWGLGVLYHRSRFRLRGTPRPHYSYFESNLEQPAEGKEPAELQTTTHPEASLTTKSPE